MGEIECYWIYLGLSVLEEKITLLELLILAVVSSVSCSSGVSFVSSGIKVNSIGFWQCMMGCGVVDFCN